MRSVFGVEHIVLSKANPYEKPRRLYRHGPYRHAVMDDNFEHKGVSYHGVHVQSFHVEDTELRNPIGVMASYSQMGPSGVTAQEPVHINGPKRVYESARHVAAHHLGMAVHL